MMTTYTIRMGKKVKTAQATNPLSACTKAYRVRNWHWEYDDGTDLMNSRAFVKLRGKIVARCMLVDNG